MLRLLTRTRRRSQSDGVKDTSALSGDSSVRKASDRLQSLDCLDNRHYDPTTGTFLSVDPLVTKTMQPYIYGAANPVTFSDPSGLDPDTSSQVRSQVEANGGCTYSSGYKCFENKAGVNSQNHTKARGNRRQVAQARYAEASLGYGAAPSVFTREFDSIDDALAALDGLSRLGGPFADGGTQGANNLTTTVSGYQRANGTYVLSYTRYNAGVADVGNSFLGAGDLKVTTRIAGKAFLVLDVGVTAFSSYRATERHSELYRISYSATKTAATAGDAAGGAWLGGKGGAAVGCWFGPLGCGAGGFIGGLGGAVIGGIAADRATDEILAMADEAEAGYDVEQLKRRGGRRRMGSAPAEVVPVRIDPELKAAIDARAVADDSSTSEVIRQALRRFLEVA